MIRSRIIRTIALTSVCILADPAIAAIYTVTNTDDAGAGSLRQAIGDANSLAGDDTIEFGVTGIISLTGGQLTISSNVSISGPGAASLRLSGSGLSRVFEILNEATVDISGLTVTNGSAAVGGGIANYGILTLSDSLVSGNTAESDTIGDPVGGGIANFGTLTINDSNIDENKTEGSDNPVAGGIANYSTLKLNNSTVSKNESIGSPGLCGGIYNTGFLTLNGSHVDNNRGYGGGISNGGTMMVYESTVNSNFGFDGSGGIGNGGTVTLVNSSVNRNGSSTLAGINNGGTMTLINSTVSLNGADSIGGISNRNVLTLINSVVSSNFAEITGGIINSGEMRIIRSTISNNYSYEYGGGIYNMDGVLTLDNSTISNNSSNSGGGVWNTATFNVDSSTISENEATTGRGGGIVNAEPLYGAPPGTTNIRNSIIANNRSDSTGPDVEGEFNSLGHNLIGKTDGSTGFGATGDLLGTVASPLDPLLGPLQDNGGPTQTHALLPGSAAIDAGNNDFVESGTITDQRGFLRIVNGTVDIGAVESGDEGSYVFVEDEDGLLTIEAEHYKNNVPAGGARKWARLDPAAANASNGQAIRAANGPATATPGVGSYTTYVVVLQPGTHDVWVRFRAFSLGTDSLYFQFDNGGIQYKDLDPEDGQWHWAKLDEPITVDTEDVYTLVVYRRERLTELDKFVLTTDLGFDPTFVNGGLGPDESAWLVPCDTSLDFDGDLIPDCSDPDDDNDGVHDWYEIENMLNPFDPTDALLDPDGDGISTLDEFLRNDDLDPNDPDTDDDGIGDALDTQASYAKNECTGGDLVNATLERVIDRELTCAARTTITVNPPTEVEDPDGHLILMARRVSFQDGFKAGRLTVFGKDPCPSCPIGTGLVWDQNKWDTADWQ